MLFGDSVFFFFFLILTREAHRQTKSSALDHRVTRPRPSLSSSCPCRRSGWKRGCQVLASKRVAKQRPLPVGLCTYGVRTREVSGGERAGERHRVALTISEAGCGHSLSQVTGGGPPHRRERSGLPRTKAMLFRGLAINKQNSADYCPCSQPQLQLFFSSHRPKFKKMDRVLQFTRKYQFHSVFMICSSLAGPPEHNHTETGSESFISEATAALIPPLYYNFSDCMHAHARIWTSLPPSPPCPGRT